MQGLGSGTVTLGVHIAAPGLAIQPGSGLDRIARERLSTVYMPGWKITMLPDAVVQAYTLDAGRDCPAVSLYLTLDEATLQVRASQTRLERVPVATNLRHDRLDGVITEAALAGQAPAEFPHAAELAFCWRLARELKARREQVRGKPETFTRPDYDFRLDNAGAEPSGDEQVSIAPRQRGAPLDLIVSEAMILANSTWSKWLADLGVPGLPRAGGDLAPGIKVRMGTKPLPHAGMGVAQYTWATSPLRRYVDLVNQWQLIACARHGRTAALAAPFKPKDASLFSVISAFDAAYTGYGDFQRDIERYWTLRWLQQQGVGELEAAVIKDGLVRAQTLPLVFRVPGSEGFARGTRLKARIAAIDLLTLELHATLLARLEDGAAAAEPGSEPEDDTEAAEAGAALRLAIDVEEAPAADAAPSLARPAAAEPGLMPELMPACARATPGAAAMGAAGVGGCACRGADGALRRSAGRQPGVRGHAAGGDPGQRALGRQAGARAGDRAAGAGGEAARGQATSPLPPAQQLEAGDAPADARRRIDSLQEEQQQLLAQIRREVAALPPPDEAHEAGDPQHQEQEERRRRLLKLLAEIEKRVNDENARPKKRYISPATREEVYALYYDALRRKIEDRGTRDFPQHAGRKLYGELTMNITVDAGRHRRRRSGARLVAATARPARGGDRARGRALRPLRCGDAQAGRPDRRHLALSLHARRGPRDLAEPHRAMSAARPPRRHSLPLGGKARSAQARFAARSGRHSPPRGQGAQRPGPGSPHGRPEGTRPGKDGAARPRRHSLLLGGADWTVRDGPRLARATGPARPRRPARSAQEAG